MSADRPRRRDLREPQGERDDTTTTDQRADEALRSLARILARETARELFAKSYAAAENDISVEGQT